MLQSFAYMAGSGYLTWIGGGNNVEMCLLPSLSFLASVQCRHLGGLSSLMVVCCYATDGSNSRNTLQWSPLAQYNTGTNGQRVVTHWLPMWTCNGCASTVDLAVAQPHTERPVCFRCNRQQVWCYDARAQAGSWVCYPFCSVEAMYSPANMAVAAAQDNWWNRRAPTEGSKRHHSGLTEA